MSLPTSSLPLSGEKQAGAYPRPQMQRSHWMNLNGPWRFLFEEERRFRRPWDIEQWPQLIEVPYPPESQASGIGDRSFHSICWYQRDFRILPEGGRVLLRPRA